MIAIPDQGGTGDEGLPTIHHFFNRFFFAGDWAPLLDIDGFAQIRTPDGVLAADCIVVHLPSILATNQSEQLSRLRKAAPDRQVWVAETLESAGNFPQLDDPAFMALFDIEASYRQTADVWTPYIPADFANRYRDVQPGARRRQCCAFISSSWDKSDRRQYMRELMRQLNIHSYGKFMRNRRILMDRGEESKLRVLKKYRYTLAFENSLSEDYVTEKFYQPLLTGTIPIYLGAPNIEEFAPGDNCFINAQDFSSPGQLVEFVQDTDPSDFHRWRQRDLRSGFLNRLEQLKVHWKTRLAQQIAERLQARS